MNNEPPLLSGTVPGLLDSSQPSRLLRSSTSSLFFVPFDPLTARATGFPNLSSLHIDPTTVPKRVNPETVASSNGKRIVVETDPVNGTCSWRFVPRAKTESGLPADEGSFPRLVELCGQLVYITQDQWDLYKLDPFYDCVVRAYPNLTKITKVTPSKHLLDLDDVAASTSIPRPKQDSSKATGSDSYSRRNKRCKPSTGLKRTVSIQADCMSVDEDSSRRWTTEAENLRRTAPEHAPDPDDVAASDSMPTPKKDFFKRTLSTHTDSMSVDGDSFYIPNQADQDASNDQKRKWDPDPSRRWTTSEDETLRRTAPEQRASRDGDRFRSRSGGVNDISNSDIPAKKARTRSPGEARRKLDKKRTKREMKRRAHMEARLKFRRDFLHQAFWDSIGVPSVWQNLGVYEDLTGMGSEGSDSSADESQGGSSSHSGSATSREDEAQRLARIEESRRKLAELEKDRPLWEESAKRRQAREKEQEEMRQRAKKAKEEEERRQQQAQAAKIQRKEKREKERQERERETRKKEKKWRMFVPSPPSGFWSFRQALDRYLRTAETFDATKFSAGGTSLTFAAIPWPMLESSFSVQDIDWDAVEKFFGNVKMLLKAAEYKDLVEKSHRRFHPDRWRSRGLLSSVKDELERDLLEVAGSTVVQAITPMWEKVKER